MLQMNESIKGMNVVGTKAAGGSLRTATTTTPRDFLSTTVGGSEPSCERSRSRGSSSLGFLQHRLQRSLDRTRLLRTDSNRTTDSSSTDGKGPLGLNLLYEPSEPQIDFIFIHGLGGGSRKTWSDPGEPGTFWPKEWLPNEVGFRHVRLHSYGYNWTTRSASRLGVHDFGQTLLADMYNSPYLRKHGETPIVIVAHSMGGLVAKKAYLLATRDPTYEGIARRIQALYFLGTPHRGADSVHLARLMRQSAGFGTKAFLDDLAPGCGTLDQINDEFRHVCDNIRLWSFSEAMPTKFGLSSSLVVEKESAILGLPKEHVQYIQADHRHICKFDSPVNPNYIILRRAFVTTIEDLGSGMLSRHRTHFREQMKKVASLLPVKHRPDAALLSINRKQHTGSCQWLTDNDTFQDWLGETLYEYDGAQAAVPQAAAKNEGRILWLSGRPGTGKTVAAGHVVRYLRSGNFDCSFYFFRYEDRASATVASMLRSLAFQMAEMSFEIRNSISSLVEDDVQINHDDHNSLWTNLFIDRIFSLDNVRTQYWLIDAVDECSSQEIPALLSMLLNIDSKIPIQVLMTSRPGIQVERLLLADQPDIRMIYTGQDASEADIRRFLEDRCSSTGYAAVNNGFAAGADSDGKGDLVSGILNMSNGNFLWASLTVSKLDEAYSVEDKQDILRQIPPEMDEFYSRIVASISESPSAQLAQTVLSWVVCSSRPLSLATLKEAIKLDMGRTLTAFSTQLETMTGHLLMVDSGQKVRVAHRTTSAFLTQSRESGFRIKRPEVQSRILEVCLQVLCGPDFAPPKTRKGNSMARNFPLSPFAEHAAYEFVQQLSNVSSSLDAPLQLLNKFLRANVLVWIERVAQTGSLWLLQLATRRLKSYLARRAKYQSEVPLGGVETQTIASWANDLYHIVAAFHSNLLTSPSSIYSLIPSLCPSSSIVAQIFAKPSKRLRVTGPVEETWNDRLASYVFPSEPTAIVSTPSYLAVGLDDGTIDVFHLSTLGTFNHIASLAHGKKFRQLAFHHRSRSLASCGARMLVLWGGLRSKTPLWSRKLDFTPSSLDFAPDGSVISLTNAQGSAVVTYRVTDGEKEDPLLLHSTADSDSMTSDDLGGNDSSWRPAERIRLDRAQKLAAISYRNGLVSIWDLCELEEIGIFEKEGSEDVYLGCQALDMVFNPVEELDLLAISYKGGDLVTCNPWTLDQTNELHLPVLLFDLSATSNGQFLAGAAEDGAIYIFQFETLQLVYQISRPDNHLWANAIAFSADDSRFIDIRGHCCNIWEPYILASRNASDDSSFESHSEALVLPESRITTAHLFRWGESITALESTPDGKVVFAGRQDGSVDVCNVSDGSLIYKLRLHHSFAKVSSLEWNDTHSCLLSLDSTGRHIVSRLTGIKAGGAAKATTPNETVLDFREAFSSVRQTILSHDATAILIRTGLAVKLVNNAGVVVEKTDSTIHAWWAKHPTNKSLLVVIQDGKLRLFEWATLTEATLLPGITLLSSSSSSLPEILNPEDPQPWAGGHSSSHLATRSLPSAANEGSSYLLGVDVSKVTSQTEEVNLQVLRIDNDLPNIHQILGCLRSNLYFMDPNGWICSISLKNLKEASHFTRHFFIPMTWRTGPHAVVRVISKSAVAIGREEQLMIFHGFLEFEEKVLMGPGPGPPGPAKEVLDRPWEMFEHEDEDEMIDASW